MTALSNFNFITEGDISEDNLFDEQRLYGS